jgi:hypothetical protein
MPYLLLHAFCVQRIASFFLIVWSTTHGWMELVAALECMKKVATQPYFGACVVPATVSHSKSQHS